MAAGAAVAVVGWWSGYKLGGVIALTLADFLENLGIENYWQLSFLGLGIIIILLNIGILFIKERNFFNIKNSHLELDEKILGKLNYNNIFTKILAWVTSTISGPLISLFKKKG